MKKVLLLLCILLAFFAFSAEKKEEKDIPFYIESLKEWLFPKKQPTPIPKKTPPKKEPPKKQEKSKPPLKKEPPKKQEKSKPPLKKEPPLIMPPIKPQETQIPSSEPQVIKKEPPLIMPPIKPQETQIPSSEPQVIEEEKPKGTEEYFPEKLKQNLITNVFIDSDIRQALKDIAFQAGKKIIMDDTVRGVINIELEDVPFEDALRQILIQGGYTYKKFDDYYLIGLLDPKNPTFKYLSTTERIKLKFVEPLKCKKFLPDSLSSYITEDKEGNSLIVNAPLEIIEIIKERLQKIDIPSKKVLIEVLVVEILKKSNDSLGTNIEWSATKKASRPNDILEGITFNVDKEAILKIKALTEKGEVKIRANPKILTLDGRTASFSIYKEEYYMTSGTIYQPYSRFESIKTGIAINVTPFITSENKIFLSIEPEISDISEVGKGGLPIITRRKTNTELLASDKETITIGGLIQESKEERRIGIPILQKIPLLGKLIFSYKTTKTNKSELTIFITPYIIEYSQL